MVNTKHGQHQLHNSIKLKNLWMFSKSGGLGFKSELAAFEQIRCNLHIRLATSLRGNDDLISNCKSYGHK